MRYFLFTIFVMVFSGCNLLKESQYNERDTVITVIPELIRDTIYLGGELIEVAADCDTFEIAKRFSFDLFRLDSAGAFWRAKYDAQKQRFEILARSKIEVRNVKQVEIFKQEILKSESVFDRYADKFLIAFFVLGLIMIGLAFMKK